MGWLTGYESRHASIRRKRTDGFGSRMAEWKTNGVLTSIVIAFAFWLIATSILMMREQVIRYRPGQYAQHDLLARVDFRLWDSDKFTQQQRNARENTPRVYKSNGDNWKTLEDQLLSLPDRVSGDSIQQLPAGLRDVLDSGTLTLLQQYQNPAKRARYEADVKQYIKRLRDEKLKLVLIDEKQLDEDIKVNRPIFVTGIGRMNASEVYAHPAQDDFSAKISRFINEIFELNLQPKILAFSTNEKTVPATHVIDEDATTAAQNDSADKVPREAGDQFYRRNAVIVSKGPIQQHEWQLLRAENEAFVNSLGNAGWKSRLGLAGLTAFITFAMAGYVAHFQPRVVRNHARAIAIVALILAMLLLSQLSAIGSGPIFLLGIAPTILSAIILTIAYDQRFAIGLVSMQAMLVTVGLDQGVGYFAVLWVGVLTSCFMLNDIRTRSKLIEVGGSTGLLVMGTTFAVGAINLDPIQFTLNNALYAFVAALSCGFIVLGILPFIEKSFRITTSMTLLELADASQPLLRRLALEAPGTYNHSLQVATLSENAAEAIGANSLLCRVAAYYHDVGKINKADYFIENQTTGENRHINLSPSVSLLIIIGHVKDGIELAKMYNLPTSFFPFIQQHHGTTLVEYFYYQACTANKNIEDGAISEMQYRYPGPKPRTKEVGILMLADAVEGACRAMPEPTASRIETLVHDIALKRLTDGQFDECDLTMRELELIEKSLVKTLLGIYHGRIAYPSTQQIQNATASQVKSA